MLKTYTINDVFEEQLQDIMLDSLITEQDPVAELIVNDAVMTPYLVHIAEQYGCKLILKESLEELMEYTLDMLVNNCDKFIILPDLNNWLILGEDGIGDLQRSKIKLFLSTVALELYDNQRDNEVAIVLQANIASVLEDGVVPEMYSVE